MKITIFSWPAIAMAAALSFQQLANSSDVLVEENVPATSESLGPYEPQFEQELPSQDDLPLEREPLRQREQLTRRDPGESHGVLANRFSTLSSARPGDYVPRPAGFEGNNGFQMASWNDSLHAGGGPSPGQYPSALPPACDDCECCPDPLWMHRTGVFFDWLIVRPGNIDYVYAVEQTGPLPTDSPTGPTGRVGFDTAPGYRLGANWCLSDCTSLQVGFTWFEDGTNDTITATPGNVLIFQPGVPSIPNVGATSNQASARYDIGFRQLDIDYRSLLWGNCDSAINYFAGLRYANMEQRLTAEENIGVPVGLTTVRTDIDFDGFGIGFGLDGMRRSAYTGLLIYAKGSSSFVAGEYKADYQQTTQFGPNSIVGNSLVDYRVVTILQSELGIGWQSGCGTFRVLTGYQFNGWFNSLTTGTYIGGVQTRQFDQLFETVSFDGFVGRLEWRF